MTTERRDNGFTLMEVLISLTLLSIVLGAVYSSFFSIQRALERFETVSLKYHEARTTLDIMRREVESSFLKKPRADKEAGGGTSFNIKDRDIFGKNASALDLTAFSFKGGKVNTISYFVTEKEGGLELMKTVTPSIMRSGSYTVEMMEDIEGFSVEMLYNNNWVGTWNASDTGKLPDIVRLSIVFDDHGKNVTLTEYARPRVGKRL
ncbi:MAG TPA: prepilin-type N-terminal cleavage/methylation domain-containing protein [Nitrospirae bacterium]|nr:pseudopilin GspJ [bacterium BMS3Abin09]GBE40443.1 pseudopilin GspJ [bacterium BMS3Bbin09]HDH34137.1 prepilin-type N-terminal cleavage/methylation domain-containing protein [Nitrospirota bacterium]HDN95269.1 prepilin-type N-terminal cleavage/methylation domain-containing protein [Nitrospirota bacterium]HDO66680.1 prepilin-type N-terminal cleavage/methylation domain-containing protein [Nitrospirota bacterium]